MSKDEQKIYFWGYVVGLVIVVACIIVVINESMAKNDVYAGSGAEVDKISAEVETEAETGGLMPCEAPENFREWYATYSEEESESETSEKEKIQFERGTDTVRDFCEESVEAPKKTDDPDRVEESGLGEETEVETGEETSGMEGADLYTEDETVDLVTWHVNGEHITDALQGVFRMGESIPEAGKESDSQGCSVEGKEGESATGKETELQTDVVANRGQEAQEETESVEDETKTQTTTEVEVSTNSEDAPIYSVNGEVLNPDLQGYLYQRLSEQGCEFFFRYAILICYQESHFNCTAVNPVNHEDMGLFQFKSRYWDWSRGDIFDPYVQIDVFVENMANRANMGLDVYEMISRHNVSDFGSYNSEYVREVMQHEGNLRTIGR